MQIVHTTDVIRRLICIAFIRRNYEPGTKHHLVVWLISEFLTLELECPVTHSITIARYPYHRQPFHYSIHSYPWKDTYKIKFNRIFTP